MARLINEDEPLLGGERKLLSRKTLLIALAICCISLAIGGGAGVLIGRSTSSTPKSRSLPIKLARQENILESCINGTIHRVNYTVNGLTEDHYFDLDTEKHLKEIECDLDQTTLTLHFTSIAYAAETYARIYLENFFVTGSKGCKIKDKTKTLLRRVIGADLDGDKIVCHAVPAMYDEVFESADIRYSAGGQCAVKEGEVGLDKQICIGFNNDCKSQQATQPLPLYQNQFLSVTCSNCFLAFEADVILEVKISSWRMSKLRAGFKNMTVNGAMVLDLKATAQWSNGIDKVLQLVPQATLIDFDIGPVPFMIFFDVPVEARADIQFLATAEAQAGVIANWTLGDLYIQWDPTNHWQHETPSPKLTFKSKVGPTWDASFDATANFALVPTVNMHLDHVYTYRVTFDPELNLEAKGDAKTKQLCASSTYDMKLTVESEIDINIPVINIHDDWVWGPKTIWEGQGSIAQGCYPNN